MDTINAADIDWNHLWTQEKNKKTWKSKTADDWDKKAASFAERTATSIYTNKFLALLKPDPQWSILDTGCGPGTLTLPLAPMVRRLTALDFSRKMLEILETRAGEQKLDNILTRHAS